MKQIKLIMGMPIAIETIDSSDNHLLDKAFTFFRNVDNRYSTYKPTSEISQINSGLPRNVWSTEMKHILQLCEQTKAETNGYFNIQHNNLLDPSGLVKGWAIHEAAQQLLSHGVKNFYIEAGGDIQVSGNNAKNQPWTVGIRNPFNIDEIIKKVLLTNQGIATSGTYIRGQHIYDPYEPTKTLHEVKSLTVIASNVYEADRFATAAFAMGIPGIEFIEETEGLEGYMVDNNGIAMYTTGFEEYTYA